MKTADTLLSQLDEQTLTYDMHTRRRCQIAEDLEHRGQYEAARDALAELWQGIGQRPKLEGLTKLTAAELLLRAGSLSGLLGSTRQIEGAQGAAKDLISESITSFQSLGELARLAAAQSELGYCYWREGAYDNARIHYAEALKKLTVKDDIKLRATTIIRYAAVEACCGRHNDALRMLTDATPIFEASVDDALKGKFHLALATVLVFLGKAERRPDYTDRAVIEFTAAAYHFEQAGHISYLASTENNLGFLLYTSGRFADAHIHLNHARRLFLDLKESGKIAQVDDVQARVLLAEGRPRVAARMIDGAVRTLSRGGEQGVLAEALTTQGRVLARLNDVAGSQSKFRQAADLAEQAGAVEDAGRALLALIEEHGEWLAESELVTAYERADELLKATQDAETIARLRACARRFVVARRVALPVAVKRSRADFWRNFSLPKQVQAYEARYIRRALLEAQGSVSRAARLLGFKHHASLVALLQRRHKSLAHLRTMPEKRKQSIIRVRGPRHSPDARAKLPLRVRAILHVEDNQLVADVVRDVFEMEGWQVKTLVEGTQALSLLAGQAHFDLLLLDNDLPGVGGLELIREVRRLAHRRHVPIIMLSADDVKTLAERAGADVFLRKPEDIPMLCQTVRRLLDAAGDA